MNKSELIEGVAPKGQLSFNKAMDAADAVMETIAETMHKGESATLVGLDSFVIQKRKAREGHSPATGDSILIPTK